MSDAKFKIGDIVYLKTGSKDMVVKEISGAYLTLTWEQEGEFVEKEFHQDMLEKTP